MTNVYDTLYGGYNKEIYETFTVKESNESTFIADVKQSPIPQPPNPPIQISSLAFQTTRNSWYQDYTVPANGYFKQDKIVVQAPKFLSAVQAQNWEDN